MLGLGLDGHPKFASAGLDHQCDRAARGSGSQDGAQVFAGRRERLSAVTPCAEDRSLPHLSAGALGAGRREQLPAVSRDPSAWLSRRRDSVLRPPPHTPSLIQNINQPLTWGIFIRGNLGIFH